MDQQEPLGTRPEDQRLERALASLVLRPSRVDRDRLMFEAGRQTSRSHGKPHWVWPVSSACSSTAALLFLTLWMVQSQHLPSGPGTTQQVAEERIETPAVEKVAGEAAPASDSDRQLVQDVRPESALAATTGAVRMPRPRFLGAPEESLLLPRYLLLREMMLTTGWNRSMDGDTSTPAILSPPTYREERERYLESTRHTPRANQDAAQSQPTLPLS